MFKTVQEICLIIIFNFTIRIIFLINTSGDDYVHYWTIHQVKKAKKFFNYRIDNSLIEGTRNYPSLTHYIVSLFPKTSWSFVGKFLNITYDIMSIMIVYVAINLYFDHKVLIGLSYGFWGALIMGSSGILLSTNARLKAMGGRTFGLMLMTIYLLLLMYSYIFNIYYLVILMIIIGILLIYSSQFGFQAFLFFNIIFSLISLYFVPLLAIIAIFIMAFAFPSMGLREILNFKLYHLRWYKNNMKGTTAEERVHAIKDLLNIFHYIRNEKKHLFRVFFFDNPYTIALYNLPLFFVLLYYSLMQHNNSFESFIYYSLLSFFVIFILTSSKPLIILGESERYLEYPTPLLSLYLIYLINNNTVNLRFIIILFIWNIIIALSNLIASNASLISSSLKLHKNKSYLELINFLNSLPHSNILCVPIKSSFKISIDAPKHLYYYRFVGKNFSYLEKETTSLNIPKENMDYFQKKYGINIIVVNKNVKFKPKGSIKLIFENEDYKIFEKK